MRRLAVASLPLLFAPLFTAVPRTVACPPVTPVAVLDCLEQAYEERDIELYESLLAEDFVFAHSDTKASWDREGDLAGTRRLFENEHVASLSMEIGFEEQGGVHDGGEPFRIVRWLSPMGD